MDGFIFFLIFIFVVIPIFKNIVGGTSTKKPHRKPRAGSGQKNWAEVQKLLQQKTQEQSTRQASGKHASVCEPVKVTAMCSQNHIWNVSASATNATIPNATA